MSGTEPTQSTPEKPRRRWSPLVVASVTAAVLLAGGGGVYFTTAASDGGRADDRPGAADAGRTPPPLRLDGPGDGPGPGIAPGEPDPSGTVYRAKGKLPAGPESAPVHRAEGRVTQDEVARLAKALGVAGTPRLVGPVWKIAPPKDGFGPLLEVRAEAPGTWSFTQYDGGPREDNCLKGKPCGGGTTPGTGGTPVSEEAAKKAAAGVLKAVGQPDAELDASQVMGAVRVVNADPVVGGLPTYGWSTGVHVGPDGRLVGGSGQLEKPVKGDVYPVIGAAEALKQLNEAARGAGPGDIGGCATDPPAAKDEKPAGLSGTAGLTGPTAPTAPCRVAPDRVASQEMTVTRAVFGLAAQLVDGRQALVPSWLFEVEPKAGARPFTVAQTAVAPQYLSPRPTPTPTPVPVPSDDAAPPRQIQSYSVEGRTLSVTFWGGVCSNYAVRADESAARVSLTITETPLKHDRACIAMAVEVTKTVTLKEPLGGRQVVDAASGERVPRAG